MKVLQILLIYRHFFPLIYLPERDFCRTTNRFFFFKLVGMNVVVRRLGRVNDAYKN